MAGGEERAVGQKLDGKKRRSCAGRLFGLALNVAMVGGLLWWWHPDFIFDRGAETDMNAYCGHARAYDDATEIDASSAEAMIRDMVAAAEIARDLAETAPPSVRDAHDRLARGGEILAERVERAAPKTMAELPVVAEEAAAEVEAELADLDGETAAVMAYAASECNLSFR
jgi:hypothetical protein